MKIVITSPVKAFDLVTEEEIADAKRLSILDGLAWSGTKCTEYMSDELYYIGIIGGEISLSYDSSNSELRVVTSYQTSRKLEDDELEHLKHETCGQWSDGIGEGEFLHAEELGIFVDISNYTLDPEVAQFDDGVSVPTPQKSKLIALLDEYDVDEDAVIELVENGASLDDRDRYGTSVLELACCNVLSKLVNVLAKREILNRHTNEANRLLFTVAYSAQSESRFEPSVSIARHLFAVGADVETTNDEGHTPLMIAANRDNLPLVKYLIDLGADINRQRRDKSNKTTALMMAQDPRMVQYLLEHGADPNIRTAYGKNAYEHQLQNSHQKDFRLNADLMKPYLK